LITDANVEPSWSSATRLASGVLALKKAVQLAAIVLLAADPPAADAEDELAAGALLVLAGTLVDGWGCVSPPDPLLPQAATLSTAALARTVMSDRYVLMQAFSNRAPGGRR
jgi:hypothetical protein